MTCTVAPNVVRVKVYFCVVSSHFVLQSQIMLGEVQGVLGELPPNAWQHQCLTQLILGLMQQHTRLPKR